MTAYHNDTPASTTTHRYRSVPVKPTACTAHSRRGKLAAAAALLGSGVLLWILCLHPVWRSYHGGVSITLRNGGKIELSRSAEVQVRESARREIRVLSGQALVKASTDSDCSLKIVAAETQLTTDSEACIYLIERLPADTIQVLNVSHHFLKIDYNPGCSRCKAGVPGPDHTSKHALFRGERATVHGTHLQHEQLSETAVGQRLAWTGEPWVIEGSRVPEIFVYLHTPDRPDQTETFAVSAGALSKALGQFVQQTQHASIAYDPPLLQGRLTSGFSGQIDVTTALTRLLQGTGCESIIRSEDQVNVHCTSGQPSETEGARP
jgi:hypothetical protein